MLELGVPECPLGDPVVVILESVGASSFDVSLRLTELNAQLAKAPAAPVAFRAIPGCDDAMALLTVSPSEAGAVSLSGYIHERIALQSTGPDFPQKQLRRRTISEAAFRTRSRNISKALKAWSLTVLSLSSKQMAIPGITLPTRSSGS